MTIENNFFLICESFLLDDAKRASLIGIYDRIWAENFPATHPVLKFVANVHVLNSQSNRTIDLSIEMADSKGRSLFKLTSPPTSIMPKQKHQTVGVVFDIQLVTFQETGTYTTTLREGDDEVATHILEVSKVPETEK